VVVPEAVPVGSCPLSRFWTEVEAGYGTFEDYPDLDLDEVTNGRILLIDLAISAFAEGLTNADN